MNNQQMNQVIESCIPVMRDINRFGCTLALHKKDEYIKAGIYTNEIVDLFEKIPFGETGLYGWETRRVDELVNVHIWKIVVRP